MRVAYSSNCTERLVQFEWELTSSREEIEPKEIKSLPRGHVLLTQVALRLDLGALVQFELTRNLRLEVITCVFLREKLLPFLHPALKIDKEGSKRSELWATDSISGKWEDRSEKSSEKAWRWTESGMKLEELVSVSRFQICSKSTSCELDKLLICYQLAMIRGFYWVFERVPKECSSKVEWKKKKINLKRFFFFPSAGAMRCLIRLDAFLPPHFPLKTMLPRNVLLVLKNVMVPSTPLQLDPPKMKKWREGRSDLRSFEGFTSGRMNLSVLRPGTTGEL